MRILQIFNAYLVRGGEEIWVENIPELLGASAQVGELRFSSSDWTGDSRPARWRQALLMGDNPESRAKLRTEVERFNPDVLLFHNTIPVASFGIYDEARRLGVPILQYTHNFRPFSPGGTLWTGKSVNDSALRGNPFPEIFSASWQDSCIKTGILAAHLKLAAWRGWLDNVDAWLAPSEFMRAKFIEAGMPEHRVKLLRHCWPVDESPPATQEANHYLFLGRLVAEKGVLLLLQAWEILARRLGDQCPELIIAGSGPLEEQVRSACETNDKLHFNGFIDGAIKKDLIRTCKALLVPAIWWEPLGLTPYEAYAESRPVIASVSGALSESVTHEITGWTHAPGDPEALADCLVLAEQAGASGRLEKGTQGHAWLRQNADCGNWRNRMLEICSDLRKSAR